MDESKCHCGAEGAVFLHYASKHLCEEHFIRMFDKRFRKTVRMNRMIRKGDLVAVGLSGGKDSTILLHSLARLKEDLPFEMVAVTIDEGISGYRAKTLRIAERECRKLGIEQHVLRFKEETGNTLDRMMKRNRKHDAGNPLPCTQCGVIRRYLLNKGAREAKATKLALGHNLDDIAQTVFMNLMRNEPSRLARLINPVTSSTKFVQRIRPLMLTPEKENAIYAILKGIEIDNVECPYAHFAFRSHVRRILNESEERYPGTKFKIVNAFLEMEDALREKYGKGRLMECEKCGEPSSQKLCMFCKRTNY